jgi:hypothetical protein
MQFPAWLVIFQILQAENECQYKQTTDRLTDMIDIAGCLPLSQQFEQTAVLVNSLSHFWVIARATLAIDQSVQLLS